MREVPRNPLESLGIIPIIIYILLLLNIHRVSVGGRLDWGWTQGKV